MVKYPVSVMVAVVLFSYYILHIFIGLCRYSILTDDMSDIVMLRVTSYRHTYSTYRHRQLRIVEVLRTYLKLVYYS